MSKTALIDGDSIMYIAGATSSPDTMRKTITTHIVEILHACQTNRFELYIEDQKGKVNFRKAIAKSKPYKGHRPSLKPPFIEEARQYAKETWNAIEVEGMESEDLVLIRQHELGEDNSIIAFIDKDLLQVPGEFYNYRTGRRFTWSQQEADFQFAMQCLQGDPVDNIPGLPGIGPKKAEAMLTPYFGQCLDDIMHTVALAYAGHGASYEYYTEQIALLYLLRERGCFETPCVREEVYQVMRTFHEQYRKK